MNLTLVCLMLEAGLFTGSFDVILPQDAIQPEKTAAQELCEHLTAATGKKAVILTEGRQSGKNREIYLGFGSAAKKMGFDVSKADPEEWSVRAQSDQVLVITGGRPRGTLYGVYEFLERELGVIWLDETSIYIPENKSYRWRTDLKIVGKPAFKWRNVYAYFTDEQELRLKFFFRNRQNHLFQDKPTIAFRKKWGVDTIYGAPQPIHSFYAYIKKLPPEDYDCLSKDKSGKPMLSTSKSGPGQICYTNPKTHRIFLENLRGFIKADRAKKISPVYYDISPNDNSVQCLCDGCVAAKKKYGGYSGVYLEFLNGLATKIAEEYPGVHIHGVAYMLLLEAPVGIKTAPNITIRIIQLGREWIAVGNRTSLRALSHPENAKAREQFRKWAGAASNFGTWDYWINYRGKGLYPFTNARAIVENLRFYRDSGISDVFAECELAHTVSFHPLRLWIGWRAMNNPDINPDVEIKRFITAYFGKAAPFLLEYHSLLEETNATLPVPPESVDVFGRTDLTPDFFTRANTLLDKAEKAAADDKTLLYRIGRERTSVDRAMLDISFRRQPMPGFDKNKVMARYEQNSLASYNDHVMGAARIKKMKEELEIYMAKLKADVKLPDEFKEREVVAFYPWPLLTPYGAVKAAPDPDAAGGYCLRVELKGKDGNLAYALATMSKTKINPITSSSVPLESLKSTGKYRFHNAGNFKIAEKSFFWLNTPFSIRADLTRFYDTSGVNNDVEIQFSAKITEEKNVRWLSVDRVILLRK